MTTKAYSYIRMSTDMQLKGDSLRRQLEASRAYAVANELDLIDEARLHDIGISPFRGANVEGGALGRFLDAVRNKKVEPGSILLVESLDRLSRQAINQALTTFLEIINAGVTIVTLSDNRTYTSAKLDLSDLLTSIVIMSRANEESATKSMRLGEVWANKRKNAATQPLTAICPAWLRLSNDRKRYEVIKEHAKVVRSIFEDNANGIGIESIANRLNDQKVPPFGKSKFWHYSYVMKILENRAVFGEYQPHRSVNRKQVREGDPIPNYYPSVIDEELFYRAQQGRATRRIIGTGRTGPNISNLFSGLARCAYCGSKMRFENKGSQGHNYLVCFDAKRGLGCDKTRWRYDHFEKSFLAFINELDLSSIFNSDAEDQTRSKLENELDALKGKISSIEERMNATYELMEQTTAKTFIATKLTALESDLVATNLSIKEKEKELSSLKSVAVSKDELHEMIAALQGGQDNYKLRARVASKLQSLVSSLEIAPAGFKKGNVVPVLLDLQGESGKITIDPTKIDTDHPRYFMVKFKNGQTLIVTPDPNDPFDYRQISLFPNAHPARYS